MARAARLAGALLLETGSRCFLVGQTKEPCDFGAHGFEPPSALPDAAHWFVPLRPTRAVSLPVPRLVLSVEGEEAARVLVQRFVIERNGSVSERLWRLVLNGGDPDADDEATTDEDLDARWLGDIPAPFWNIVRDTVLRCV
jgi:hypothetical protein